MLRDPRAVQHAGGRSAPRRRPSGSGAPGPGPDRPQQDLPGGPSRDARKRRPGALDLRPGRSGPHRGGGGLQRHAPRLHRKTAPGGLPSHPGAHLQAGGRNLQDPGEQDAVLRAARGRGPADRDVAADLVLLQRGALRLPRCGSPVRRARPEHPDKRVRVRRGRGAPDVRTRHRGAHLLERLEQYVEGCARLAGRRRQEQETKDD
mmetsp:Transcript_70090/g.194853  ORF Transcript_70090/g.194853 Transcript_70090/m.194853 type:complete len:205 (+) Transcript_70090:2030-2644(+)